MDRAADSLSAAILTLASTTLHRVFTPIVVT